MGVGSVDIPSSKNSRGESWLMSLGWGPFISISDLGIHERSSLSHTLSSSIRAPKDFFSDEAIAFCDGLLFMLGLLFKLFRNCVVIIFFGFCISKFQRAKAKKVIVGSKSKRPLKKSTLEVKKRPFWYIDTKRGRPDTRRNF